MARKTPAPVRKAQAAVKAAMYATAAALESGNEELLDSAMRAELQASAEHYRLYALLM